MGIVKRKPALENYLDEIEAEWRLLSDKEYKMVMNAIKEITEKEEQFSILYGDAAFHGLEKYLPFSGYIYSFPHHPILSIYPDGGETSFAYMVSGISSLDREKLNSAECILSNAEIDFAYMFNHEWQSMCPEVLIEKKITS